MTEQESFDAFWKAVLLRVPKLREAEKVTASVEIVRRLCQDAHAVGFITDKPKPKHPHDLFEQMFGGNQPSNPFRKPGPW